MCEKLNHKRKAMQGNQAQPKCAYFYTYDSLKAAMRMLTHTTWGTEFGTKLFGRRIVKHEEAGLFLYCRTKKRERRRKKKSVRDNVLIVREEKQESCLAVVVSYRNTQQQSRARDLR